jgi:hypothetical protein
MYSLARYTMGPVWDGQEKDLISTTLGCQGVWGVGKFFAG